MLVFFNLFVNRNLRSVGPALLKLTLLTLKFKCLHNIKTKSVPASQKTPRFHPEDYLVYVVQGNN